MSRSFFTDVIVLSSRQFGEDNRIITLISPEKGIFDAILYGGRKNKLRSLVSPYHSGTMWLYNDETRHSIKITDFDVKQYRPTIRENLYKTCASALATELVIKTQSGNDAGQFAESWVLYKGFLDGLDLSDESQAKLGLLRFLWRFLGLLGLQPDPFYCSTCGNELIAETENSCDNSLALGKTNSCDNSLALEKANSCDNAPVLQNVSYNDNAHIHEKTNSCGDSAKNVILFYSEITQEFICNDCAGGHGNRNSDVVQYGDHYRDTGKHDNSLPRQTVDVTLHCLSGESIHYLQVLNTKKPAEVRKEVISSNTLSQLHDLLFMLISRSVDVKLKSLEAGNGIL